MRNKSVRNGLKLANSIVLAFTVFSCSSNALNTATLNNSNTSSQNKVISSSFKSNNNFKFGVKFSSAFNPEAYFLAWSDIRTAIKNKSIPDTIYHYTYAVTGEPSRTTDSNYLTIKNRVQNKEWSEEAYLIANPDIKAAIDAGTAQSGYSHWYNYAITAEPSRQSSTAYMNAKAATDLGFSEKAYRLTWADVDSAIKSGTLPSAYAHWNTYAKNNEPSRLSDPRYVKIKAALDLSYDENTYLLAFPDIRSAVTAGSLPSGLRHYIDQGVMESRLETLIYQDAKLAILNDFDESYHN